MLTGLTFDPGLTPTAGVSCCSCSAPSASATETSHMSTLSDWHYFSCHLYFSQHYLNMRSTGQIFQSSKNLRLCGVGFLLPASFTSSNRSGDCQLILGCFPLFDQFKFSALLQTSLVFHITLTPPLPLESIPVAPTGSVDIKTGTFFYSGEFLWERRSIFLRDPLITHLEDVQSNHSRSRWPLSCSTGEMKVKGLAETASVVEMR